MFSVFLSTNADVLLIVGDFSSNKQNEKYKDVEVEHCYVTLISEGSSDTLYFATCKGKNDDGTY